jgi:hypothetical protein
MGKAWTDIATHETSPVMNGESLIWRNERNCGPEQVLYLISLFIKKTPCAEHSVSRSQAAAKAYFATKCMRILASGEVAEGSNFGRHDMGSARSLSRGPEVSRVVREHASISAPRS